MKKLQASKIRSTKVTNFKKPNTHLQQHPCIDQKMRGERDESTPETEL